jgi:hypothetical protein
VSSARGLLLVVASSNDVVEAKIGESARCGSTVASNRLEDW